jgi:hypothetical protein
MSASTKPVSRAKYTSKRKNVLKYKDESHLLSLSSIKLNRERDRRAFMLQAYSKPKTKKVKSTIVGDDDEHCQSTSYVPNEELCDKIRESLSGTEISNSLIYMFMKQAKEDHDINPNKEFEKFLYFVHTRL